MSQDLVVLWHFLFYKYSTSLKLVISQIGIHICRLLINNKSNSSGIVYKRSYTLYDEIVVVQKDIETES